MRDVIRLPGFHTYHRLGNLPSSRLVWAPGCSETSRKRHRFLNARTSRLRQIRLECSEHLSKNSSRWDFFFALALPNPNNIVLDIFRTESVVLLSRMRGRFSGLIRALMAFLCGSRVCLIGIVAAFRCLGDDKEMLPPAFQSRLNCWNFSKVVCIGRITGSVSRLVSYKIFCNARQ